MTAFLAHSQIRSRWWPLQWMDVTSQNWPFLKHPKSGARTKCYARFDASTPIHRIYNLDITSQASLIHLIS